MVVGEGFAPVRHREVRIDLLSRMELLAGLYPTEAVHEGCPPEEVLLRFRRGGRREFEGTHVLELCLGGSRAHHEEAYDQQEGTRTVHRSLLMERATHTAPSFGDERAECNSFGLLWLLITPDYHVRPTS